MAIALDVANVGEFAQDSASTTIALTTGATVAAGGFIVLAACWAQSGITMSSVAGGSLSWTIDTQGISPDSSQCSGAVISAQAPSGLASGTTITATLSSSSPGGRSITATSFTGVKTSAPAGVNSLVAGPAGVAAWASGSLAIAAGSLIACLSVDFSGQQTSTVTGPSVEAHDLGDAGGFAQTTCYRIESGAGSYTVAGTWSANVTGGIVVAVEYQAAPAVTPGPGDNPPIGVLGRGAGW